LGKGLTIHRLNHNNPDNSAESKTARNDTGNIDHSSNTPNTLTSPRYSPQPPPFSSLCHSNNTSTDIIETDNTATLDSSKPSATDNNDHNRTYDPGGNSKLVYDPGRDSLNTKDGASRDDDERSSNSDNAFCSADIHHSPDRDSDKTSLSAFDINPALRFVQTIFPNATSPRPTDNLPAILQDGSKCTDEAQRLSLEG